MMLVIILLLVYNSSRAMWWGGYTVGSGYLVPMVQFLTVAVVVAIDRLECKGIKLWMIGGMIVMSFTECM